MIAVTLNTKIESVANLREHWRKRAARAKTQRTLAWAELRAASKATPRLLGEVVVTIIRHAPRQLDTDNMVSGCKHLRDGVADWLGVPDNDPRIQWRYGQLKSKAYAAVIEVATA